MAIDGRSADEEEVRPNANYEPFRRRGRPGSVSDGRVRRRGDFSVTYTLKARLHKPSWYEVGTTATRAIMDELGDRIAAVARAVLCAADVHRPSPRCWGCDAAAG